MKTANLSSPHADPWAEEFVDLPDLNRHATDAIVSAVDQLRARARSGATGAAPPALIAVGPAGVGKTHLFGRLRRKLGPRAALVHVRPLTGAEMSARFLLGQIVQQLGYGSCPEQPGHAGHRPSQIDIVAGVALAVATAGNAKYPTACLEELRALPEAERMRQIEDAISALLLRHRDLDPSYLERFIRIPFERPLVRTASLLWLAGRELDEAQSARIGAREPLPDGAVMPALRTIAVLSSMAAPLLLVFDQLENLVDERGSRVVAYANLVADLVDVVRDLVIVQMGLSTEWQAHIEPRLGESQRSRVAGASIPLSLPQPDQARRLLQLWIAGIGDAAAPFPWPFTQAQIETVCATVGMTPRMLLNELRRVLDGGEPMAVQDRQSQPAAARAPAGRDVADSIAAAWDERLGNARRHVDEMARTGLGPEPAFLFDGLAAAGALAEEIGSLKPEKDDLARLDGGKGVRWVALLHHANNASVRKALRRLASLDGGLVALREHWRDWPPTWKATREQWDTFRQRPGVRWHWLSRDDATRLLALAALLKDARSQDVDGPDGKPVPLDAVERWVRQQQKPESWDVALAILGRAGAVDEASAVTAPPPRQAEGVVGAAHLLRALRVASLERIIRDLARKPGGATRSAVRAELRASPAVRWIGETIVYWAE